MKNLSFFFSLVCIYEIVLLDIFFVEKILDLLTIVVIFLLIITIGKIEQVKKIFFLSGVGCIALAIILYYFSRTTPFFDVAANWTYAFLLAGLVTMVVQELKNEKH